MAKAGPQYALTDACVVTSCLGHHVYVNVGTDRLIWECRICGWVA
jgi:hypothetical protein